MLVRYVSFNQVARDLRGVTGLQVEGDAQSRSHTIEFGRLNNFYLEAVGFQVCNPTATAPQVGSL
jgi:hypothetical protein